MADPHQNERPLSPILNRHTTSEVGYPRAQQRTENNETRVDEDLLRKIFELQNNSMLSLIEAVRQPASANNIKLPEFNPENSDADARAWCNTVDICFGEKTLQGGPLIIAISGALKGSASQWLSQVSYPGMQWPQFRELLIARYDSNETPAATLINLQSSKPKENECLSVYAARLLTSLTSKWRNMNVEEIAVSTVLAHITQFDKRLQRIAFTTEIVSRDILQRELKATTFMKRKTTSATEENHSDSKRSKMGPTTKCFNCGKLRHRAHECHSITKERNESSTAPSPSAATSNQQSRVICFRCGDTGHFSSKCTRKSGANGAGSGGDVQQAGSSGSSATSGRGFQVNSCSVNSPRGQLSNNGKTHEDV